MCASAYVLGLEFQGVSGRTGGGDAASCPQHGMVGNLRTEEGVRAREIESEAEVSLSSPACRLSEMR